MEPEKEAEEVIKLFVSDDKNEKDKSSSDREKDFLEILKTISPGTSIRTALDDLLNARMGALIVFENEYTSVPIVVANIAFDETDLSAQVQEDYKKKIFDSGYTSFVTNKTTKKFTIVLNKPAVDDIVFSWAAIAVKSPKVFESSAMILPTSTPPQISAPETSAAADSSSVATTSAN